MRKKLFCCFNAVCIVVIIFPQMSYSHRSIALKSDSIILASDTVWQSDTVTVDKPVIVKKDATLTIMPGVHVLFMGNYALRIHGRLLACGTEMDSIIFSGYDSTWKGILLDNIPADNDSSIIEYASISSTETHPPDSGGIYNYSGAAILIRNFSKVRISNCNIYSNTGYDCSSTIVCLNSSPLIQNNYIHNNEVINVIMEYGDLGGGVFCFDSCAPVIVGNVFKDNYAYQGGGAIAFDGVISNNSPKIINNYFIHNMCGWEGGGAIRHLWCDKMSIINNIFVGNVAYGLGSGGACYSSGGQLDFINNTLVNDSAGSGGAALCFRNGNYNKINCINNVIWGCYDNTYGKAILLNEKDNNLITFSNCLIEDGINSFQIGFSDTATFNGVFTDNVDLNPEFVNSGDHPFALKKNSPCIDNGLKDVSALNLPEYDIMGHPRIINGRIDIGAYEFDSSISSIDFKNNKYTDKAGNVISIASSTANRIAFTISRKETPFELFAIYSLKGELLHSQNIHALSQKNGSTKDITLNINGDIVTTLKSKVIIVTISPKNRGAIFKQCFTIF